MDYKYMFKIKHKTRSTSNIKQRIVLQFKKCNRREVPTLLYNLKTFKNIAYE